MKLHLIGSIMYPLNHHNNWTIVLNSLLQYLLTNNFPLKRLWVVVYGVFIWGMFWYWVQFDNYLIVTYSSNYPHDTVCYDGMECLLLDYWCVNKRSGYFYFNFLLLIVFVESMIVIVTIIVLLIYWKLYSNKPIIYYCCVCC